MPAAPWIKKRTKSNRSRGLSGCLGSGDHCHHHHCSFHGSMLVGLHLTELVSFVQYCDCQEPRTFHHCRHQDHQPMVMAMVTCCGKSYLIFFTIIILIIPMRKSEEQILSKVLGDHFIFAGSLNHSISPKSYEPVKNGVKLCIESVKQGNAIHPAMRYLTFSWELHSNLAIS